MPELVTIGGSRPTRYHNVSLKSEELFWKTLILVSVGLLTVDLIYQACNGITYQTRESCLVYASLPRWAFLLYENMIELFMVVVAGVFGASLLERYFAKLHRFVPRHPATAFLLASVIPVCSCSAIPLMRAMHNRVPFRTLITFAVAAPLLNPYIIALSFSVLGVRYALLRIAGSFLLAVVTGYVVERFHHRDGNRLPGIMTGCPGSEGCATMRGSVFTSSGRVLRKILPFVLVAGLLSMLLELAGPGNWLKSLDLSDGVFGLLLVVVVGVPVYFCNGADVLFLQPLVQHGSLPLATALAFSLTSTSVCLSSLVLLVKYIGRRLTVVLLVSIIILTVTFCTLIRLLPLFPG
ncbi:MAG: permease [candidate division Zixibacteria bacterium]|nr:permease [candidate division Zixibacteria bacterium]